MKTAFVTVESVDFLPVGSCSFEQYKGADDIGLDKVTGAADGSVDMALGGEVDDAVDLILFQQFGYQGLVTDISAHKMIAALIGQSLQVVGGACIGEFVEVNNLYIAVIGEHIAYVVAADKACATGDKNIVRLEVSHCLAVLRESR